MPTSDNEWPLELRLNNYQVITLFDSLSAAWAARRILASQESDTIKTAEPNTYRSVVIVASDQEAFGKE